VSLSIVELKNIFIALYQMNIMIVWILLILIATGLYIKPLPVRPQQTEIRGLNFCCNRSWIIGFQTLMVNTKKETTKTAFSN
jgi:nitric oxide reductase large subunit